MRLTLPSLALGLLLCQGAFAGDGTAAIGGGLGVSWATLLVNSSAARPAQPSVPAAGGAAGSAVGARKGNRTEAAIGGGLGSAGGSLLGGAVGGKTGSTVGAGLGGAAGGALGNHLGDNNRGSKKHHRHRH